MDRLDRIKYNRREILNLMARIENETNKMFHEVLPEIDTEFHELAYSDLLRLTAIKTALQHYLDDLTID